MISGQNFFDQPIKDDLRRIQEIEIGQKIITQQTVYEINPLSKKTIS